MVGVITMDAFDLPNGVGKTKLGKIRNKEKRHE